MTDENKTKEIIDDDKNTKLHYAAANGDLQEVMKEIEGGCQIDPANFLGWTPLMMATRNGKFEVVKYMIDKRADSTRENKFGYNILLMAVASGNIEVLHFILQYLLCGGVSRRNLQKKFSPVSLAVLFSYQHLVKYLLQNSFCVNAISPKTELTPVMFADVMGNNELRQYLISHGGIATNLQKLPQDEELQPNLQDHCIPNVSPLIILAHPPPPPPPPTLNSMEMPRRCSDLQTPIFTPHISPFPRFIQQVFFPPSFSPNHFFPSVNMVPFAGPSHNLLNVNIMPPSPYYSPLGPVFISPTNIV